MKERFLAPALLLLAAGAAEAQSIDPQTPVDTTPPRFLDSPVLTPNPNPAVPLAARITMRTDEPAVVELSIDDGERAWTVLAQPVWATQHVVPLLGVRFERSHEIRVTARDAAGNRRTWIYPLTFVTPPKADFFPDVTVTVREPALMEPGVTLFNATSSRNDDGYLVIIDGEGEVIWSYRTPDLVGDAQRISNGNLLYISGRYKLTEIDMYGDPVNVWWAAKINTNVPPGAIPVDVVAFHHDVIELPPSETADFAVMSSDLRVYPDYPASETDPTQTNPEAHVVGDLIVELQRDGTIVRALPILDVLDPYRISYDSLQEFWTLVYGLDDTEDWNHGNAIVFDPAHDAYIYSTRHQEAVVRFGRDLQIHWILGPHEHWQAPWDQYLLTPTGRGPFEWNFHQHAPELTSAGTILMFDNGNGRAVAPDPEMPEVSRYSRAVEYRIDEVQRTVEQVWKYGGGTDEHFYSPSLGDADALPITGNVLMTDGDREAATGPGFARIAELTRTQPAQVVFEFQVRDLTPTQPDHWSTYRSEHLGGVYPHQ